MNTLREYLYERLMPTLLSALLAWGLTLTLGDSLALPGGWMGTAVLCGLMGLFFLAADFHWLGRIAGAILFCLGSALYFLTNAQMTGFAIAISLALQGNTGALALYAPMIRLILAVVFSLFCQFANRHREGFYPSLSLACVVVLWGWITGYVSGVATMVPALIALAALYARAHCETTPPGRMITMALAAVLCALLVLPPQGITNQALADLAERIRQMSYDYLFFNESRTVYAIQYDGFQPLGTRLGGPIDYPSQREVMEVKTPQTLLLRGVSKDNYTGALWKDTLGSRRYLYVDPRWRGVRNSLLDAERPIASLRQGATFEEIEATIRILDENASTLFVPHRLSQLLCTEDMVPYFNTTGEVFITRDLIPGDTYTVSAPTPSMDDPALPAILEAAAASSVKDIDASMLEAYLDLPGNIEDGVITLTYRLTQDLDTDLAKLQALRDELWTNYSYTLTPASNPPEGRDFVSFFLLDGREGYCTYFASAMAVMGRLSGIPTRYVEGFIAAPEDDGIARVRGENAHAWVEAYLTGFGWITIDPTPPEAPPENQDDPNGSGGGEDDQNSTPEGEGDEPVPNEPELTPEPEDPDNESPTPSPSPSPEPEPEPQADDQQSAEPTESPNPDGELGPKKPPDFSFLWWLLLPLLLTAVLWMRWHQTLPASSAKRAKHDGERLLIWYRATLRLLQANGTPPVPGESPAQLAERVPTLAPLLHAVNALAYAQTPPPPEALTQAAQAYNAYLITLPKAVRTKACIMRMVKGTGSLRQVP